MRTVCLTRRGALIALSLCVAMPAAVVAGQAEPKSGKASNNYIVQMADDPVVAYKGGIKGLQATKPNKGQKIDPNSPEVVQYVAYLDSRHDDALVAVGGVRKLYDYRYSFNGFAAELSEEQAANMAAIPGVLSVSRDELLKLDTSSTPAFLGLNATGGLWDQLGGVGSAGEDVIIGVVDGGIWPEHPSFSDRTGLNGNGTQDGKLDYHQIPGWHGRCVPGEAFNASHCNQKLIGAQYFPQGRLASSTPIPEYEYLSPRDFSGHGTHTASTAGGNAGVMPTGAAAPFGPISGIAPRARIAAYKSCFYDPGQGTGVCFSSDSVAAIDQAVADGVDVINFSVGGSRTNFRDPVEIAFLFAADAGVFVAASAGNSGPATSTVAHPGPWLTTVAAGTHNRNGEGAVTLGNGATYAGASFANALASMPLIDSVSAGLPGADPTRVELCFAAADNVVGGVPTPVLDPAKVAGKIVLCKRGTNALVNKSGAVAAAGGVGAVIYNQAAGLNTLALFHSVPTVHVDDVKGGAIKAYIVSAGASATASIAQSTIVFNTPAPFTASFSSRGPLQAGNGDLLKPDLIAPGQDILAGVAPPGNAGRLFDLYSGTSMSSPHVAGLAALLKDLHPDWSPMMIKSALMTTGYDVLDGPNTNPLVIFRQGAGHVKPNSAADPGLVYNSSFGDWLGFLCGTQLPTSFCTSAGVPVLDPSNLNTASIAIGDLAGVQTVTRNVTNVGSQAETYTASYTGLAGITVTLPGAMTIAKGATQSFNVTFTTAGAALNSYVGGQFTLTGNKGHVVRIPVVIRPVALAAPTQVSGNYNVTFGYTGPFGASARGLVAPTVIDGIVAQDPDQTFVQADPTGTVAIAVTIPAGSTYTRFSLFDADVTPGTDLDLYIYQGTTLVGLSAGATSAEEVNFTFATPTGAPIALTAYVHGWGVAGGGSSPFKLHQWYVGTTSAGNMIVAAPASATLGATGVINLTFSGLTAGTKYLGSVAYSGAAGMPNPTIVRVDP